MEIRAKREPAIPSCCHQKGASRLLVIYMNVHAETHSQTGPHPIVDSLVDHTLHSWDLHLSFSLPPHPHTRNSHSRLFDLVRFWRVRPTCPTDLSARPRNRALLDLRPRVRRCIDRSSRPRTSIARPCEGREPEGGQFLRLEGAWGDIETSRLFKR